MNAKARINVPFGAVLTHVAALPVGAQRDLVDPYAGKKYPWPKVAVAALLVYFVFAGLNHMGFISDWTGGRVGMKPANRPTSVDVEKETALQVVSATQKW